MSLNFRRRMRLGQNLGLNVSKSGISPSYRTKYGSVSFRGISMRTGIPGLTLFSRWGSSKGKSGNPLQVLLLIVLGVILAYLAIVLVINVLLFVFWLIAEIRRGILRWYYRKRILKEAISAEQATDVIP